MNVKRIVACTRIKELPDLVVEILSPSMEELDERMKKRLAEHCGIPDDWIVADKGLSVRQFRLLPSVADGEAVLCEQKMRFVCGEITANVDLKKV